MPKNRLKQGFSAVQAHKRTPAETKQKINATSADPSIWGLDLEDIEKGGRLLEHKTVGERKAVGDKTVFAKGIFSTANCAHTC